MPAHQVGRVKTENWNPDAPVASSRDSHRTGSGNSGYATPEISEHARIRWAERAPETDMDIEVAWRNAIKVEATEVDCDTVRLYAPADVVFLLRGGEITSCWPANYESLRTSELGKCGECGNLDRFSSTSARCRWCGEKFSTVRMGGGIKIIREEGN